MPTSVAVHPIVLLGVVDHYNRSCKGSKRYAVLFLLVWVDMDILVTGIGRGLQPGRVSRRRLPLCWVARELGWQYQLRLVLRARTW